jgi:hypothetical protein
LKEVRQEKREKMMDYGASEPAVSVAEDCIQIDPKNANRRRAAEARVLRANSETGESNVTETLSSAAQTGSESLRRSEQIP